MGHTGFEPTSQNEMLDAIIRHQVGLMQVSGSLRNTIWDLLDESTKEVLEQMDRVGSPEGGILTEVQLNRLRSIEKAVRDIRSPAWDEIRDTWRSGLLELAFSESEWIAAQSALVLPVVTDFDQPLRTDLRASVVNQPIQGRLLRQWSAGLELRDRQRIMEQVRVGMVLGDSTEAITQRVLAVTNTTKNNAAALTRTAVNHVGNRARQAFYLENTDVFEEEVYVATLDSRTTPICQSLDGEVFPVGEGPTPPVHINALAHGTCITTARGDVPIQQVRVGDLALTHRGRLRPIYAVMAKRPDKANIFRIETVSGRILFATDEHPLLTYARGWRRADDVKPGDKLFQHGNGPSRVEGQTCIVGEADNYPSPFDEPLIPYHVSHQPGSMAPPVDLERDSYVWKGEVYEDGVDLVLVPGMSAQEFDERRLGARYVDSPPGGNFGPTGDIGSPVGVGRITSSRHGLGPLREPWDVGLGLTEQWVIGPSTPDHALGSDRGPLTLVSNRNPVSLASCIESGLSEAEVALNGADGFELAPVAISDQSFNGFTVKHWILSEVVSVTRIPYNFHTVYNLAVEEDETYVAEGLIVHNCRSTRTPVFDADTLALRPAKPFTQRQLLNEYTSSNGLSKVGNRSSLPRGHKGAFDTFARGRKRELIGQVPARTTYQEWLGRQSASFQDEVLGNTKGALFRRGDVSLDKFVDRAGNERTIEELMKTERAAFKKANLLQEA